MMAERECAERGGLHAELQKWSAKWRE